jgi:hypothetical protein
MQQYLLQRSCVLQQIALVSNCFKACAVGHAAREQDS